MNKETLKRYLVSSTITFLTSFSLVLVTEIDDITIDSFKDGTIVGIVFVAVRAGVKSILEHYLNSKK